MPDKNMNLDELVQFFYEKYKASIRKSKINVQELNLKSSNEYIGLEAE